MSDKEKAKDLFIKGTSYYHDKNYQEALKYFQASDKIKSTETTTFYIESCKKRLNNAQNSQSQSQQHHTNGSTSNGSTPNGSSSSSDNSECEKIIKNKNYYDILKVTKDSSLQDIKKAYKKLAIRFHPDKNQSTKAEEAFKKIATAYQTLSDPEKKKMYDNYGTEEEYREKYYQAHQQQYKEEMDPFDFFDMFFGNRKFGNYRAQRYYQPQQYYNQNREREEGDNGVYQFNRKQLALFQIVPIVVIIIGYILINLFSSVPLYQFEKSYDYYIKKRTSINKIDYFVGSSFSKTYPNVKTIKASGIEHQIEREYLSFVLEKCHNIMRYKNELESQLSYYRYNSYYKNQIKNRIAQIKYEPCYKYQNLAKKIR